MLQAEGVNETLPASYLVSTHQKLEFSLVIVEQNSSSATQAIKRAEFEYLNSQLEYFACLIEPFF